MSLNKAALILSNPVTRVSQVINGIGTVALVGMMLLTTADVILRYLLNRPIVGSYELIQIMMAVLVAFSLAYTGVHKGHITIDLLTSRFSARVQAVINSITWIVSTGIFALVTWRCILYAENLRANGTITSALFIPVYPFVYVVAFGSAILCLVFIVQLFNHLAQATKKVRWWSQTELLLVILLVAAAFTVPLWAHSLGWDISPFTAGVFGIVLLIVLTFSGMFIGCVMAILGFLGMAYVNGLGAGLNLLGISSYTEMSSYTMSVLPLFILMGEFCFYSGMSQDLYYTAYRWLGHLPGGLAVATIGACAGFAAVCGSTAAEVATMGAVALPEMKKYKYNSALATGAIASGGCLAILIPPSTMMVIYGIVAEQSIGKLFLAGFIPGIIQAFFYMAIIYTECKRNPLAGPPGERSTLLERLRSLRDTWAVLALFLLVVGGLYVGIFTPTEAAGVGAFGALLFALGKRKVTRKNFIASLLETSKVTAMVFFLLVGAAFLGYFLSVSRFPVELSNLVSALPVSRYVVFAGILLVYLFLGCIMSAIVMVIITVPIFLPVMLALGFDPIWFGIIVVAMVEIAQITPPFAINVFVIHSVAKDVPMFSIFRGIFPFFIMNLVHIVLLTVFPQIVLFIPNLMR